MTKILGRKLQITLLNHGQRWNQASMPSASQGKQLAPQFGAFIASAWTTQPTAAHSGHVNVLGVPPSLSCIRKKNDKPLSTSSTATADLAKNAASDMYAALVAIHIQQANARPKAAASPNEGGSTVECTGVSYFSFLSVLATANCQVIRVWFDVSVS